MGAWWHFKEWEGWDVYLQIEQQNLCLKLSGGGQGSDAWVRASMRDRWLAKLQKASQGHRLIISQPARRGNGSSMTAGFVKGDAWLVAGQHDNIELENTISLLNDAEVILDRALEMVE